MVSQTFFIIKLGPNVFYLIDFPFVINKIKENFKSYEGWRNLVQRLASPRSPPLGFSGGELLLSPAFHIFPLLEPHIF